MHLSPRSSAPGARRINWRGAFVWLAAVALASVSTIAAAQETVAPVETHVDHAGLVKLGWQLVCPLSTFRPLTCAEAIDQLHALGIHHIEVDATQAIAPGRPAAFVIPSAGPADLAALTEKLSAVRMDIVTYDAGQIPADEPSLRKLFELAGKLKVKNIAGTPDAASLPVLDRLSAEYKVRFAIRNQPLSAAFARPEAMLGALKDCSERIGCCADLPAWKSLGLTPADCVRALGARVFEIELSDADPQNRSVVLGTGRIGALQVLRALKDESFRGAIAVAYAGDEARRSANWATSINVFSDFVTTLTSAVPGSGGQALSDDEITGAAKDTARGFGDAPDVVPAIATDLSPALTSGEVRKAMRKVADWQLARAQSRFTQAWTFGVLYTGLIAASKTTGDSKYADAVRDLGRKTQWSLGRPTNSPDNQCLGQSYADLFLESSDPAVLAPTREAMDRAILAPPSPRKKITWWWCDALFMAPGAWARLARDTGDAKYLAFLDHEWWTCSDALYNPKEHLYSRDATFLAKREPNGKPVLWSRGNGWVLAGIARTLPLLPADYPSRAKYVTQFRDMSARIVELQGSDGLWSASLLDPATYPLPEVSGSALFVYALAWGINTGLLDRATFEPVVARGWAGLLAHIYADGRLGCIQQTGAAPAHYKMSSSYVYGVGAFLLAGSEIDRLTTAH